MTDIAGATNPMPPEDRGILCPKCGCGHFRVIYTRKAARGRLVRRRECRHCGRRVTTTEQLLGHTESTNTNASRALPE